MTDLSLSYCSEEYPCTAVKLLAQQQKDAKIQYEKDRAEMKDLMDKLRDRLPPYVTVGAGIGGMIIGVLSTLVAVFAG